MDKYTSAKYIGVKNVNAMPMTRAAYNAFRGWELPSDENGSDEGYLIEYVDGGEPNTTTFKGYVSWSPQSVFDDAYRLTSGMSFGYAIEALKKGHKVAREGWNGKGMFLFLVPGSTFAVNHPPLLGIYDEGTIITYQPHIDMKTADGRCVPWQASQSDNLADDWYIA